MQISAITPPQSLNTNDFFSSFCPVSQMLPRSTLTFTSFPFLLSTFSTRSVSSLLLLFLYPPPLHHHHLHSFSSSLPSGSIHPSVHPCMHGWPSIRGSVCYTTALVLSRLLNTHTVQAEEGFIYQTELRTLPHIVVAGKTWKK